VAGQLALVGDTLSGLVDWDCAGAGAPGIDLGSLRMDAAFCYGQGAAAEVLADYEQAADGPLPTSRTGTLSPRWRHHLVWAGFPRHCRPGPPGPNPGTAAGAP
jgi:hypothetical protein